jgi:Na+/melibiose symporter-like transporter
VKKDSNVVSVPAKVLYGLGAFGYGSIGQTMGSFLMFFGTCVLGIPGVLMGLAVGLGTVWDALTDPIVGAMSDNTRSRRFGKRHGYVLFGSIAVACVNLLIWSISPDWSTGAKFVCMLVLLLVYETFCTLYSTPYGALGLDLSKTYDERTAVQSYKTVFSFLSLLVPSLLMTVFLSPTRYVTMGAANDGYMDIAYITGALCVSCGIVCFFGTYRHKKIGVPEQRTPDAGLFRDFFSIVKQKNIPRLIVGYAVSLSAGAFITTLGMHVFTYTFGFSSIEIPIIMVCLIGGIIAGQPIWYRLSCKYDKVTALLLALFTVLLGIILFTVIFCLRGVITTGQAMPLVAVAIFICGVGTGCLHSIPISMYADCIYKNLDETGVDRTAKSAGFLTFCTKFSNAGIMFVIGLALDLVGFRGASAVQSVATQNWLGWLLILGVSTAAVLAIFIYSKYTYSKKDFNDTI